MNRPGAALLESLVAEERRGLPGPARAAASAAAPRGGAAWSEHLFDQIYALLVGGEPREAQHVLHSAAAIGGGPGVERRLHACRSWAEQLDRNWYPGDTGAEIPDQSRAPTLLGDQLAPGDPETMLLEVSVAKGPLMLLSARAVLESLVRQRSAALRSVLAHGLRELQQFAATAQRTGAARSAAWAAVAQADLAWRSGFPDEAGQMLGIARSMYAQLNDPIGAACAQLVEGDWYAAPGSSPEALGFALAQQNHPSPLEPVRDRSRALRCYEHAAALLDGVSTPRTVGAVALRRAYLSWMDSRFEAQRGWLEAADEGFAEAGDAAARRLVTVHRLLSNLASGEPAAIRLHAGTGWDHRPRGPIADVLAWATERGSASFGAGLGRLLERAAEAWLDSGDFDRAAVAYSMALPLVQLGGGILPAGVLDAQARVDDERNFTARALVRLEQAVRALPAVAPIAADARPWMQQVSLVMSMVRAQSNRAGSSAPGFGVPGLERAIDRLRQLGDVEGVPDADVTASLHRDADALLAEIARAHREQDVEPLMRQGFADSEKRMITVTAQAVRDQIAEMTALVAVQRGRLAHRAGWLVEADRWFSSALAMVDAGPPAHQWIAVLACAASLREDEALARFRQLRASGLLKPAMLASLALRARDYAAAEELFAIVQPDPGAEGLAWSEVAERVELALETGALSDALVLARIATDRFESIVGSLGRDPDRLAMCDDVKATSLYLSAARAAIELGEQCARDGDLAGREAALADAFEWSDRGRSLALATLVRGTAEAASRDDALRRSWQQAATEWSASFERLLAAYEAGDDDASVAAARVSASDLTRADESVVAIESKIGAAMLQKARQLPARSNLSSIQHALTRDACLLQYHVVGRELLVWGVTADRVEAGHRRLATAGLEALVGAHWRGCSNGRPGEEADELSSLLLAPVAGMLEECRRVVVVPFGALAAVPFHALPFRGRALGEEHVVSFLPAGSLLAGRRLDDPIADGAPLLAVGDPAFDRTAQPSLPRLPGAAVEARAVGRVWGSQDVLVDEEATEPELRRLLPGRAVVHLAAHGQLDEISPSNSGLVLAGTDRLTVSDLIGLQLDGDLAVLSACDSGRGTVTLGGDVIGLTRGLLAGGVRRAVVSLWPVDDLTACATMVAFHERLLATAAPAQALAEAQADIRGLSGSELAARYAEAGGKSVPGIQTVRRASGTPLTTRSGASRAIPLDPSFVETLEPETEPVDALDGGLERVWAPFVLVGP